MAKITWINFILRFQKYENDSWSLTTHLKCRKNCDCDQIWSFSHTNKRSILYKCLINKPVVIKSIFNYKIWHFLSLFPCLLCPLPSGLSSVCAEGDCGVSSFPVPVVVQLGKISLALQQQSLVSFLQCFALLQGSLGLFLLNLQLLLLSLCRTCDDVSGDDNSWSAAVLFSRLNCSQTAMLSSTGVIDTQAKKLDMHNFELNKSHMQVYIKDLKWSLTEWGNSFHTFTGTCRT